MKCKRLRRTTIKAGTFHPGIARDFPDDVLLRNMSAREYQTMRQQTESPLFPFWGEGRGSSFFLASLVLVTIFVPMITLSRYGRIGFGLMFALMPFSGAVASIRKRMTGTVYSSNGAPVISNNFLLDGTQIANQSNWGAAPFAGTTLGVGGIQEYKVLTSAYDASYGMSMGSEMVMISRGGTNQYHVDVFEYLRNSAFNARNFFDGATIPHLEKNKFGASFGSRA